MGSERAWVKTLLSSFAVQLTTLPVLLRMYGEVSVLGIVLNLAVLPTVSVVLICGLCCVAVGFMSISAAGICLIPGKILLMLYEKLCVLAGAVPFCTWIGGAPEIWQCVVYYVLLFGGIQIALFLKEKGAYRVWRVLSRGICVAVVCVSIFILGFRQKNLISITCLDIGQGDGIVIQLPGGKTVMVDGGSSSKKKVASYQILPYLKNQGISVVDAMLISHTDLDHISGVQELLTLKEKHLTTLRIKNLLLPDWKAPEEVYYELEEQAEEVRDFCAEASSGAETAVWGWLSGNPVARDRCEGDGCK